MSWRIEIVPDNSDQWVTNGLRFATKEETEAYISTMHWTLVCETRVVESDDPVNNRWVDGKLVRWSMTPPHDCSPSPCGSRASRDRSLTMSWSWEILTDQWMTCGLRFATKEEAEASVFDLTKGFYETRVTETDDPVNHRWVEGKLVPVNPNCESCGVELKSDPPQDDEFTCWCHQCNVKRTAQPPTQQSLAL